MIDYGALCEELSAVIEGVENRISNLANVSALLFYSLNDVNWVGFYLVDKGRLVLGPFQGRVACTEIEVGCGVCGAAVAQNRTMLVKNVHEFEGHIACDKESNSEIVLPIRAEGRVVGVLDIDSPVIGRFEECDREGLERIVGILENRIFWGGGERL